MERIARAACFMIEALATLYGPFDAAGSGANLSGWAL
jgi:hypothetical protein